MNSLPYYILAIFFAGLAAWRVTNGVDNNIHLVTVITLVVGAMGTVFLERASAMKLSGPSFSIEIKRAEERLGVGGGKSADSTALAFASEEMPTPAPLMVSQTSSIFLRPDSERVRAMRGFLKDATEIETISDSSDPNQRRFGSAPVRDGLSLVTTIMPHPEKDTWAVIKIRAIDTRAIAKHITFFLHPTFKQQEITVGTNENGVAELVFVAWGAFTVGAKSSDGRLVEVNLATITGGPDSFYSR